jgi:hypothetical protein
MKTLPNFETYRKPHQNFFTAFLLCHWTIVSGVHLLLDMQANRPRQTFHGQFTEKFTESQTNFTATGDILNAALSSMKAL